jgi:hypothetical protein
MRLTATGSSWEGGKDEAPMQQRQAIVTQKQQLSINAAGKREGADLERVGRADRIQLGLCQTSAAIRRSTTESCCRNGLTLYRSA